MLLRIALTCGFLFANACGQASRSVEEFSQEVAPGTLKSEAFGLSVVKPEGWYSVNQELQDALVEEGGKVASLGNQDLAAKIELSKPRSSQIFGIFKYEPGSPVDSNPNVLAMAENVKLAPGVKTGSDYFYHFRKLAATSNIKYDFEDEITPVKIGDKKFDRLNAVMAVNGYSVNQSYYASRREDFIILIIQSYQSPAEKAETDAILDSIEFQ